MGQAKQRKSEIDALKAQGGKQLYMARSNTVITSGIRTLKDTRMLSQCSSRIALAVKAKKWICRVESTTTF